MAGSEGRQLEAPRTTWQSVGQAGSSNGQGWLRPAPRRAEGCAHQPASSIMKPFAHGLTVLVACVVWAAADQAATPQGAAPGATKGKPGGRPPTYGGGPVQSGNAVKYDAEALKAQGVPDLTTDNKNTLVRKYPGKLLLSASSIW